MVETKEDKSGLVAYVAQHGTSEGWAYLAQKFNISTAEAARSHVKRQKKAGKLVLPSTNFVYTTPIEGQPAVTVTYTIPKPQESHTIHADGSHEFVASNVSKAVTINDVLRDHNLDPTEWTLVDWSESKWDAQVADGQGESTLQTLYSHRIKVKPLVVAKSAQVEDLFLKFAKEYKGASKNISGFTADYNKKASNCLIISLSDLHLEKKSYGAEVGGEDEGMEQAYNRALSACYSIVSRAASADDLAKIVLIAGNDFFHTDNAKNTTVAGTPLDSDGRWHESFRKGLELATALIDFCKGYAPVKYYSVPGNHGESRELYLAYAVQAFYRNDSQVSVDVVVNHRQYFTFGNSVFMLTHEPPASKAVQLPVLFITEQPQLYAAAKYRFVLTGHLHKKNEVMFTSTSENFGLVFKILPSLSGTDLWHHKSMFVHNHKACIGLLINDQYGDVAEYIYND